MRLAILSVALLFTTPVLAQDLDGGIAITLSDGGVVASDGNVLEHPQVLAKIMFDGVKNGDWLTAASAFLVLVISLLKMFAAKIHKSLPKTNPLDKVFTFLLETKPGGWLMNFLVSLGVGVGTALVAEGSVTWSILKPVIWASLTAAALWELVKDVWEWWQSRKEAPAPVPVAPADPPKPEVKS